MVSHENTSKYGLCELDCDRKVALEFHVRGHTKNQAVFFSREPRKG